MTKPVKEKDAAPHGISFVRFTVPQLITDPILFQLSREDEAAVGNDDLEVSREDQNKINNFSRLHQREMLLEEDLKAKAVGTSRHF